jgi:hypothetical protein
MMDIANITVILPWKVSLDYTFLPNDRELLTSFPEQFLEGITLLDPKNIAQLDLNPDNVVVDDTSRDRPQLLIIDLDLSISVEDEMVMIVGFMGLDHGPHSRLEFWNSQQKREQV